MYMPHYQGALQDVVERRFVDGTIERYESPNGVPIWGGTRYFRPKEFIDPYDNRKTWTYDASGRVIRVAGANGVDHVYNYNPEWIGTDAEDWSSGLYSGIEIRSVDRLANDADLNRTVYRLYQKRRDSGGVVIQGCRPEAGDLLHRIYSPACDAVDPLQDPHQAVLVDLATERPRLHIREYLYDGYTPNIAHINVLSAESILSNAPTTSPIPIVSYAYTTAGGRRRVLTETQHQTGATYTFSYVPDIDSPLRVQTVTRTGVHDNVVKEWALDDYERVISITTTPPNNSDGRPRAFDADNGGYVEPVAMTVNYTYSGCATCASRPSAIVELPSGRRWEYDYDALTGLLLESRVPDPSGAAQSVATTYTYEPCVAGSFYGAYRMTSVTDPEGRRWEGTYTSAPRATPPGAISWGVKHASVTWTSPSITLADGTTHASLQVVSHYDTTRVPQFDGYGQMGFVGLLENEQDGDGVATAFEYDAVGALTATVRNPGGGAQSLRTEFDVARNGDLRSMTTGVGSTLQRVVNINYDQGGQAKLLTTSASGQTLQERRYYDQHGNVTVVQTRNKTSTGAAPDDFGTAPRPDNAREWLRSEFHYKVERLVLRLRDRRAIDRDEDVVDPVADAPDAKFLREDLVWTPEGSVESIVHGNGSASVLAYDGYGSLYKAQRTSVGQPPTLIGKYFVNNALELVREYRGDASLPIITTITRNSAGIVTQIQEPSVAPPNGYPWTVESATHTFSFDVMGRLTEATTKSGATVIARRKEHYDQVGRSYKTEVFDGSLPSPIQVFKTQWDDASKPIRTTGPAGRFVERSFDALARVAEVRDCTPNNPDKTTFEYFANTNFLKKATRRNWDALASPAGYVDREVEYVRDNLGRVLQMRVGPSATALVHSFSYYSAGFTESYTDPGGKVERFLPDAMGRLVERFLPSVDPIWNETEYRDWTGQVDRSEVRQRDARGRLTRTVFDYAARPLFIMEPGASTEPSFGSPHQPFARFLEYDAASRLLHVYAGDDLKVRFDRDGMGRVLMRARVAAATHPFVSSSYGRDEVRWNVLGQMVESISRTGFGPGGIGDVYVHEHFEHDAVGRLHEERFEFTGATNAVEIAGAFVGDDSFRSALTYSNNLGGNTDDLWLQYVPDAAGRLQTIDWKTIVAGAWTPAAAYQHEGGATRRRTTHWDLGGSTPGSFDTTYHYDPYGRMSRIEQSFSATAEVQFEYDLASNLVKEKYTKQGGSGRVGDRFTHDEHHRLKKAWLGSDQAHMDEGDPESAVGAFVKKLTYGLDAANNRTSVQTQYGQGGGTVTSAYATQDGGSQGPSNRYDTVEGLQALYDARGNTVFDGRFYYIYDALNRLTEVYAIDYSGEGQSLGGGASQASTAATEGQQSFVVSDPSALRLARDNIVARAANAPAEVLYRVADPAYVAELREPVSAAALEPTQQAASATEGSYQLVLAAIYLYDVMNRRVVRIVIDDATYYYAWDGWQEAQELTQSWNGAAFVAKPRGQFSWGKQLDELVAYRTNVSGSWATYYVAEGGAHCPNRVLDATGNVVEIQEYDPYGKTTFWVAGNASETSAHGNPFGWKGHRIDQETGLVYMRHRYYTPMWGRFLTQDPLGDWADAINRGCGYAYCGNGPLTRWDPLGLQTTEGMTPGEALNEFMAVSLVAAWKMTDLATGAMGADYGTHKKVADAALDVIRDMIKALEPYARPNSMCSTADREKFQAMLEKLRELEAINEEGLSEHWWRDRAAFAGAALGVASFGLPGPKGPPGGVQKGAQKVFEWLRNAANRAKGTVDDVADEGAKLGKQLASEAGVAELRGSGGIAIAGAGTKAPLRDVARLVEQYGGKAEDWAKVTSTTHKFANRTTVEVHAYKNTATGEIVEMKTKLGKW